jgi:hypothetical protein
MNFKYRKIDDDFAVSDETGCDLFMIRNVTKFRQVRNVISWLFSDTGFNYQIDVNNKNYRVRQTFGGWGFIVINEARHTVGNVRLASNDKATIKVFASSEIVELKKSGLSTYGLFRKDKKIGAIITSGGLNSFPSEIEIDGDNQLELQLLSFFAAIKCY